MKWVKTVLNNSTYDVIHKKKRNQKPKNFFFIADVNEDLLNLLRV